MENLSITGIYTDLYQLTMAQVYFQKGKNDHDAVFDYFFRKNPFNGGYTVFAGLETALKSLQELVFTSEDIRYLKAIGLDNAFANSLENFRFNGRIYAAREGEVIFPNEPVLRVEASLLEAQLVETLFLNTLNFQSLIRSEEHTSELQSPCNL